MAKHSASILELARRGAQHRFEELQQELASLVKQFPDLRSSAREIVARGRLAVQAAATQLKPRKRRRLSAAARARISAAQRARWAKHKAAIVEQREAVTRKAGKKR
jgi:antibiotic biosynthesis monooxygenase (ABM) superfamily enzyme